MRTFRNRNEIPEKDHVGTCSELRNKLIERGCSAKIFPGKWVSPSKCEIVIIFKISKRLKRCCGASNLPRLYVSQVETTLSEHDSKIELKRENSAGLENVNLSFVVNPENSWKEFESFASSALAEKKGVETSCATESQGRNGFGSVVFVNMPVCIKESKLVRSLINKFLLRWSVSSGFSS